MTVQASLTLCGVALICASATTALALPTRSFERAEIFAKCSGGLSALAARQRALNDDGAADNAALAARFDGLLDAIMPHAVEQGVPWGQGDKWRWGGWADMAGLLADIDHSFDAEIAQRARTQVDDRVSSCKTLLLPAA